MTESWRQQMRQRQELRTLQDRLIRLLRRRWSWTQRWSEPIWPTGPSPLELETQLWPAWEWRVREMIEELEGG